MAVKHKKNKKPGNGGKIALRVFAAVAAALVALVGAGGINAGVVRIHRAEVVLEDLPQGFDGIDILYASDINLCGLNTPEKSGQLFRTLQSLQPDILLLGGDYTSPTLLEVLNQASKSGDFDASAAKNRRSFFHYIYDFDAPLGKFAIAAPEDPDWTDLADCMREAGVRPLFNDRAALSRNGDTLWLTGICQQSANLNSAGSLFRRGDCVISVAYSPSVLPVLLTSEASDGGQWNDLLLCGHTHGGQVRLFGRSALALSEQEQRFPFGWFCENTLPVLVTQGVGCEGFNVRLGTEPEVWLLTLRGKQA